MGPPDSRRHFTLTVLESVPRVSSKNNDDTSTSTDVIHTSVMSDERRGSQDG